MPELVRALLTGKSLGEIAVGVEGQRAHWLIGIRAGHALGQDVKHRDQVCGRSRLVALLESRRWLETGPDDGRELIRIKRIDGAMLRFRRRRRGCGDCVYGR